MIRKRGKNVVLAVNKLDTKNLEMLFMNFIPWVLGSPFRFPGSKVWVWGDLLDAIIEKVKKVYDEEEQEDNHLKWPLLGSPTPENPLLINKRCWERTAYRQ